MDLNNLINKIGIKQKEENKALDTYIENSNQNNEKLETLFMDLNNLINKIGIKQKEENKALDTYIENSNQNNEKLETLLSEFLSIINDKTAPYLWKIRGGVDDYYNYINKKINNFDFDIRNVNLLTGNLLLYQINDIIKNNDENTKFGLFLSALINKNLKAGEKVQITALMPINFLFYRLENSEAYANIAGADLGDFAKNSKIYADEAGKLAGNNMVGCELHVKKVGDDLGLFAENSKVYAEKAGKHAGNSMVGCELHVKKVGDDLGYEAKNSKIYAEEAGKHAGDHIVGCELHVRKAHHFLGNRAKNSKIYAEEAGDSTGLDMENCELHVRKAKDSLGILAKNSKIYADEAGEGAGKFMQNSELFIYELKGELDESCLTRNNKIYLRKESYEKFPEYHGKVEIWEKKALEQELNEFSRAVKYGVVGGTSYGSK